MKLSKPFLDQEELDAVKEVLDSGWLASGPKAEEFEKKFAKYIGTKYAISVNSCASALQLAIQGLGLRGEIIVPSFTFSASVNAIINAGCKPVFCDIDYDTCNIDVNKLKITSNIVGIMPVHFAGQCCQMDKIMELAKEYNIKVIEDSAECIGGEFKGKKAGSFGDFGCFSFFPTKNMTTGEGGMLTTNNKDIIDRIKALRGHGILKNRNAILPGYNLRMCDINAGIGIVQLSKLDKMNDLRIAHAKYLNEALGISEDKDVKHVYQMYTIKSKDRTNLMEYLKKKGIQTGTHFDPPVHLQDYYKRFQFHYDSFNLPVTELVSKRILSLPMHPDLTKEQLDYMIKCINTKY